MICFRNHLKFKTSMTKIWTDSKVRDIVQEEKSIIEDAQMTLRDNTSVHTQNVRNSMGQRVH